MGGLLETLGKLHGTVMAVLEHLSYLVVQVLGIGSPDHSLPT